ncbi:MAG: hypothetical protein AAF514_17415, partial [Verrucomicrobiota bacterium]
VTGDLDASEFSNPPTNLSVGGPLQNSNEFYALCESEFHTLANNLTVGEVNVGDIFTKANKPLNATIAAGTVVNSTMIHFDPNPTANVAGTITFPTPILGIIWSNGQLDATDGLLGIAGATYPGGGTARGTFENTDTVTVTSANSLDILFRAGVPYADSIRVITAPFHCSPVPEPLVACPLGIGLALTFLLRRRR